MKYIPTRYIVAILTAVGLAIVYGLRVNINITMVMMVNHTIAHSNDTEGKHSICGPSLNDSDEIEQHNGEYEWSNELQGYVLSSYYWGYLVMMFPGARLCELMSVKWMWFLAVFLNVVGCLLLPLGSDLHVGCAIAVRVLQGLGGGISFPATSLLLASWVPLSEKNTFASIVFSGSTLGTVFSIIITGVIDIYCGWRAVFYIMGVACIPWLFLWWIFVGSTPESTKFINPDEIEYILSSQGQQVGKKKKIKIIWKNIFTSMPFWALLVAHTCFNWNFYLLLTDLPIYLRKVYGATIETITIYSSIGYFSNWLFSLALGRTLDYLRKREKINQTWAKKIANLFSTLPIALAMICLCYSGCNEPFGATLLILSLMFYGGMWPGIMSNHVDIGPRIAATLMGMTNTPGTMSGIGVPIFVGFILGDGTDMQSWRIIFWVAVGFFAIEIFFYTFWGSGEVQNYYEEHDAE
ncbi:sialin-like [Onthophagus taurus]|uniref:sialin-like n=1 Tax=Onthophagus taurus TaxID=166361 RepID=UPI000C20988A|nr:sialin-like [Onthophagus taurus]